jgi:hypothetical protein
LKSPATATLLASGRTSVNSTPAAVRLVAAGDRVPVHAALAIAASIAAVSENVREVIGT